MKTTAIDTNGLAGAVSEALVRHRPVPGVRCRFEIVSPEGRALLSWLNPRDTGMALGDPDAARKVADLAIRHRVAPLLYRSFEAANVGRVAPAVVEELRRLSIANAARNLWLGAELRDLVERLESQRIRVIPYKGIAVSLMAYDDEALRQVGDIDLWVEPGDYDRARTALEVAGWRLAADWGWERTLLDASGRVAVDLHRSMTAPSFRFPFDFERVYARRVSLRSRAGALHSLAAEDLLIVLCVQVVKDGWAGRCVVAKICDLAALIRSQPTLDWHAVLRRARALGCLRVLATVLTLAEGLLGADIPPMVRRALPGGRRVEWVARQIASGLFPTESAADNAFDEERFYRAARERWRDRWVPGLQGFARRALVPNERDCAFVQLPAALAFLYYAVRPLRWLLDQLPRPRSGADPNR